MPREDSIYFSVPCDRYTPFSLARKIGATAILESASFARGKERYSILMSEPAFRILQDDAGVAFIVDGRRLPYKAKNTTGEKIAPGSKVLHTPDILDALLYVAQQNDTSIVQKEDGTISPNTIPVPTSGLGYLSYEFAARCDVIEMNAQIDELHIPESEFVAGHIYIIFDHFTEMLHVFALNYNEHQIDLDLAVENLKKRLNDMDFSYLSQSEEKKSVRIITDLAKSEEEYKEKVREIKKRIEAGDLLQAVPSRRLQFECESSALEIYRRLRSVNPSPYLFYLDLRSRRNRIYSTDCGNSPTWKKCKRRRRIKSRTFEKRKRKSGAFDASRFGTKRFVSRLRKFQRGSYALYGS